MRWVLRRRGLSLAIAGILAAVVVASGFMFLHSQPAHADANGSCGSGTTQVCAFRGNTANAFFETDTDCASTGAGVAVSDDVVRSQGGEGTELFLIVDAYNFCDPNNPTFDTLVGQTSAATFTVGNQLQSASIVGTVSVTDDVDPTRVVSMTVNLSCQGFGPTTTQIDSQHIRGDSTIFSMHYHATSRAARCSGSISDGMTEYAPNPSTGNTIQYTNSGTISISH